MASLPERDERTLEGGDRSSKSSPLSGHAVASIDRMTAITLSCTKQLENINTAMERVLARQGSVEHLAATLEHHASGTQSGTER